MTNKLEDNAEEVYCQTWQEARNRINLIHCTEIGGKAPLVTSHFADVVDASKPHSVYTKREASNKYKPHYFLRIVSQNMVKSYKIYAVHHYD